MSAKRGKQNSERFFSCVRREEIQKGMVLAQREDGEKVKVKYRRAIDSVDIFASSFSVRLK